MRAGQIGWNILIGFFLILSSCSDYRGYVVPDTSPHLRKNVALIAAKSSNSVEAPLLEAVTERVEQRLNDFSEFSRFYFAAQTQSFLRQYPQLQLRMVQLESTFALSGISDKNISSHLGETLEVEQLFIIQMDEIPCSECSAGAQFLIKFYLVDAFTGSLLWRGRVHKELDAEDMEKSAYKTMVIESTDLMLDEFEDDFNVAKQNWVSKNLKKLTSLFDIF